MVTNCKEAERRLKGGNTLPPLGHPPSIGISMICWHKMLLCLHRHAKRKPGPATCDEEGHLLASREVNKKLWEVLEELHEEGGLDFPIAIQQKEDFEKCVSLNRSPWHSSESHTMKMSVSETDKIIVNQ